MLITVNMTDFAKRFPELTITDQQLQVAYDSVPNIFEVNSGFAGLSLQVQTNGVYLATAHNIYLMQNPDKMKLLNSASEGDASAGFENYKYNNYLEYFLMLSPYGMQLLAILKTIQPPLPNKSMDLRYYQGFLNGYRG